MGCRVRWTLGLFYVPTVIFKLEHHKVQVYIGLCNRFIWPPLVVAIRCRIVMSSRVNLTQGGCWMLLVVSPWNDVAPLPERCSAQPCPMHQHQEGLAQCWCCMGRRQTAPDHGGCHPQGPWGSSVWWVGVGWNSRGQPSAQTLVTGSAGLMSISWVSAQNVLVWNFIFCIQRKPGLFEYSDGSICYIRQLATVDAKHHLDLIFFVISKCLLSHHYCTKKRTFFTNYKPFLYCLCSEREKQLLFSPEKSGFRVCICHFCAARCY